jgi:Putative zinc finger protein
MNTKIYSEDSFVGYNKKEISYDYYTDEEEDDFYDRYEPEIWEEEEFDSGEYQPFVFEEEDDRKTSPRVIKPISWSKLSPPKSVEKSPTKLSGWWDKMGKIDESKKLVNGILNYSILLPPRIEMPKREIKQRQKKNKAIRSTGQKPKPNVTKLVVQPVDQSKPTRMCLSVLKNTKCFHKAPCRFAHDYKELKECNFGERCKKITILKKSPTGELELGNKNGEVCSFKHANESKTSYLKRVPQQTTSPKNRK